VVPACQISTEDHAVLHKLLYVSRATPQARDRPDAIEEIVAAARSRNAALGVTGMLIFTQDNFAQILEGPGHALDRLMRSIERDPRHTEVRTLLRQEIESRTFQGWRMGYEGSSVFIARHIRVLTACFVAPSGLHVSRLMELMASLRTAPEPC
jgi:Sensors of blue-light using FAD